MNLSKGTTCYFSMGKCPALSSIDGGNLKRSIHEEAVARMAVLSRFIGYEKLDIETSDQNSFSITSTTFHQQYLVNDIHKIGKQSFCPEIPYA